MFNIITFVVKIFFNTLMVKTALNFLVISFLFFSCTNQVIIDNPSTNTIQLSLANKNYVLNANSSKKIKLKSGSYKILSEIENGKKLLDTLIEINSDGIINATNYTYILWTDIFCQEEDYGKFKDKLHLKDTVVIEGLEFVDIDFVIKNEAFISKKWDYSLDEKMPKSIDVPEDKMFKIVSKIYRLPALKDEFNFLGDIDFNDLNKEEIESIIKSKNENE